MIAILRILLALSVFFTHVYSGHWFSGVGGDTAVELFFIISGFYMQEILVDRYKDRKNFYSNRFLRIFPIYFIVLIATFLHDPSKYLSALKSCTLLGKAIFIESNLTLFGLDQLYFVGHYDSEVATKLLGSAQPATDLVVVPVAWSISIELFFYAIVPFLVKLQSKYLISIAFLSLSAKYLFLNLGSNQDPWTYRFLPFELSFFLIGMLISRFRVSYVHLQKESKLLSATWALAAVSWYLFSVHLADHLILSREFVLLSGCLLILSGVMLVNKSRVLRKMGDLSYPIYLSHVLIASQLPRLFDWLSLSTHVNWMLTLIVTVVLSYLLIIITTPVEKLRSKIRLASK